MPKNIKYFYGYSNRMIEDKMRFISLSIKSLLEKNMGENSKPNFQSQLETNNNQNFSIEELIKNLRYGKVGLSYEFVLVEMPNINADPEGRYGVLFVASGDLSERLITDLNPLKRAFKPRESDVDQKELSILLGIQSCREYGFCNGFIETDIFPYRWQEGSNSIHDLVNNQGHTLIKTKEEQSLIERKIFLYSISQ